MHSTARRALALAPLCFGLALAASATGCGDDDTPAPIVRDAGRDARVDGATSDGEVPEDTGMPPVDGGDLCDGVDCSGMDDMCNTGVCNAATGECAREPRADGTACDDGSACTSDDACAAGACIGAATDCSAMTDMCNVGMCDSATGACMAMPMADGSTCDDGDGCTTDDACTGGACAGAAVDCTGDADMCNTAACDPATGTCVLTPVADDTACDDADACTAGDVCTGGACAGAAVDCSSLTDACNAGTCNATSGACEAVPVADGTSCDDARRAPAATSAPRASAAASRAATTTARGRPR